MEAPVTIRRATDCDGAELRRLAGRDTRPVPPSPLLVAERAGSIEAALSISSGQSIADPFRPTAHLVAMLRAQAAHSLARDRPRAARRVVFARPVWGSP